MVSVVSLRLGSAKLAQFSWWTPQRLSWCSPIDDTYTEKLCNNLRWPSLARLLIQLPHHHTYVFGWWNIRFSRPSISSKLPTEYLSSPCHLTVFAWLSYFCIENRPVTPIDWVPLFPFTLISSGLPLRRKLSYMGNTIWRKSNIYRRPRLLQTNVFGGESENGVGILRGTHREQF